MKMRVCYFVTLFCVLVKTQNSPKESVEYYLGLLQEFTKNVSQWKQPTDSRNSFQLIDTQEETVNYGNYDFIIVGAGTSGSVLTNRLTESGKLKVLVLEAGGRENDFTDVPGFLTNLAFSDFNWGYITTPQRKSCLGFQNKQCNYPRGKAVGGSSVVNSMLYVRGNKEDFDNWGRENPGWDYESVLPYFKKSENSTLNLEEPDYHGHDGPLSIEDIKYRPDILRIFLKAGEEKSRVISDYNGKEQKGYSTFQMMTRNGRRCSANKAFVEPALERENLELLDHALVTKILIKSKMAYGVEFVRNGKKYKATSLKEVIICGGTINSPQILMLSGIGPKEHLEELGIPIVQDLPVGKTLRDHIAYPGLFFSTNISINNEPSIVAHIKNYLQGYGLLTSAGTLSGVGFESLGVKSDNPNSEYILFSTITEQAALFLVNFLGISEKSWQAISRPISGKYIWSMIPILLHPKSEGTITLKSKDPLDFPLIDFNHYSDEHDHDMDGMLAMIRDIFEVSKTTAFQSIDSKYLSDPLPACRFCKHLSDDYWRCELQQLSYPSLHAVSTCKMGPKCDATAVVDNKLRVYGISGLRVADASVIPFPFSSHPAASVYMIGEKAADLMRKEYGDL